MTSIDIRTNVKAENRSDKKFKVNSKGVGRLEGEIKKYGDEWKIEEKVGDIEKLKFVTKAAELTFNYLGESKGIELNIDSKIPLGSGLGSSSAVITASIGAISSALNQRLEWDTISQLAFDTEVEIQGAASRAGVKVATHGGFMKIEGEEMENLEELIKPSILVGYTGIHSNTGKLVEGVEKSKESKPKIIEPIIKAIGKTTETGIEALKDGNLEKVGGLMNANQNLLEGLGVSSSELRELIRAAHEGGALGAKITGAGGGGCMVALASDNMNEIAGGIEESGGEPIKTKTEMEGLKY